MFTRYLPIHLSIHPLVHSHRHSRSSMLYAGTFQCSDVFFVFFILPYDFTCYIIHYQISRAMRRGDVCAIVLVVLYIVVLGTDSSDCLWQNRRFDKITRKCLTFAGVTGYPGACTAWFLLTSKTTFFAPTLVFSHHTYSQFGGS